MPILIKGSGDVQKTPTISVSSSGLITATAGKKKATTQLSSSHDSDFVAANIRSGKTIFGVAGSAIVSETRVAVGEFYGEATATATLSVSGMSNNSEILSYSIFTETMVDDAVDEGNNLVMVSSSDGDPDVRARIVYHDSDADETVHGADWCTLTTKSNGVTVKLDSPSIFAEGCLYSYILVYK